MEIEYVTRNIFDFTAIDTKHKINVVGVVYETPTIVCYKLNSFETITLCKETNLLGKSYLVR